MTGRNDRKKWPEPDCWPAVFVKTMVCGGNSFRKTGSAHCYFRIPYGSFSIVLTHKQATVNERLDCRLNPNNDHWNLSLFTLGALAKMPEHRHKMVSNMYMFVCSETLLVQLKEQKGERREGTVPSFARPEPSCSIVLPSKPNANATTVGNRSNPICKTPLCE